MIKKGFTLIELLAVIVILAVIALIATPMILGVIETARKSSAESSAAGYIDSVEKQIVINQLDDTKTDITDGVYNLPMDDISVKGEQPTEGWIVIENNKVSNYSMRIMNYIVTFGNEATKEGTVADKPKRIICKRATVLHTEECTQTSNYCYAAGYTESGSKKTTTITYGNLGTLGTLTSGDAFDCDVDGDGNYGEYDEATGKYTERFYYVSNYYNTVTKSFETDKAVLVYYNGISRDSDENIIPSSTSSTSYDWTGIGVALSAKGPRTAIKLLPEKSDWTNVRLFNQKRNILTYNGTVKVTDFDYSLYAARMLSSKELSSACGFSVGNISTGQLDKKCTYMLENTKYSSSTAKLQGIWLENPVDSSSDTWTIEAYSRWVDKTTATAGYFGTRPVIEVLKENIEI